MKRTEVVAKPIFRGPQAIAQTPKQLRSQMQRDEEIRSVIEEYIKKNMVAGKDYGKITIERDGKSFDSKPSLFKPGAEKFCGLFKIRPTFRRDPETAEMLGNLPGIIAYVCELVDSRGRIIGEGRGTAKTDPNGKDFDINKQVKIAQKRAQIDAVLRTGALSDFFTQDMEDAPKDSQFKPLSPKQRNWISGEVAKILKEDTDEYGHWGAHEDSINLWLERHLQTSLDKIDSKQTGDIVNQIREIAKEIEVLEQQQDSDGIDISEIPY